MPGHDLRAEHQLWLAQQLKRQGESSEVENPCIRWFGPDPDRRICKGCRHLYPNRGAHRTYWKCSFRKETRGPGSDHRVNWPACLRFEEVR